MHVEIDEGKCCGAGQCVLSAPEIFDQREDDGVVVLLNEQIPPELESAVRQAAQLCPARAITIVE